MGVFSTSAASQQSSAVTTLLQEEMSIFADSSAQQLNVPQEA